MGLPTRLDDHAWDRHEPLGRDDRGKAQARLFRRAAGRLIGSLLALTLWVGAAAADTLRVATYNVDLSRDGPGLLLRDILKGEDPQIAALAQVITHVAPDILILTDFDYDRSNAALQAFADTLSAKGTAYPYHFATRPNRGWMTGIDLDGDGRTGGPGDAHGYGAFAGQGGMAILSRWPIDADGVQDFSDLLWADLPDATQPVVAGQPYPSADAHRTLRLASTGFWVVPVTPDGHDPLHILAFHATTPVFDGAEDRNGLRNADELRFWRLFLDGAFGAPPSKRFVLTGDANLDPNDSDGVRRAIRDLLSDPRLQDPGPKSRGGVVAADAEHRSDPALDTVDWPDNAPGNLRVDYVLPSSDWRVRDAGVFWPAPDAPEVDLLAVDGTNASRHRLVWVDLAVD